MADPRSILAGLRLDYTQAPDHVWRRSPYHVDTLHQRTADLVLRGIEEARDSSDASPIGVVVKGRRGTGKTHLLGWAREQVQLRDGYFFLVGLLDARSFWESVVVAMLDGLCRIGDDGKSQLETFLTRLSVLAELPSDDWAAICGKTPITRETLDRFVQSVARIDNLVMRQCRDTLRALVLRASADFTAQDIGEAYLTSGIEETPGEWASWGIRQVNKSPQEIVRDISRLLALTGPSVIAVDQIDMLVAQCGIRSMHADQDWRGVLLIEHVAHGLMSLREHTRRTLTIVSCLPDTWELIATHATDTVQDRFQLATQLGVLTDPETARLLVEKRFAARYEALDYTPPYPTWPVKPSVFAEAVNRTPRDLLIRIDEHIRSCLLNGEIREMESLEERIPEPGPIQPDPEEQRLRALDDRFESLRASADVSMATKPATEDQVMPSLLAAGLEAWVTGLGEAGASFSQDSEPSANPALHARLRRALDESTEDQFHWAFRAISATNARAVITRLRKAVVEAGLAADVPKRRLFILRNADWPTGPKTQEAVARFLDAGGRVLRFTEDDLRILTALRTLINENPPHLGQWLAARRPAEQVSFLREALASWSDPDSPVPGNQLPPPSPGKPPGGLGPNGQSALAKVGDLLADAKPGPSNGGGISPLARGAGGFVPGDDWRPSGMGPAPAGGTEPRDDHVPARSKDDVPLPDRDESATGGATGGPTHPAAAPVTVGRVMATDAEVTVPLEALRKHVVIFAGSGSGKTVLIRRLVEECALRGVSAIVLDPNNDLARLGDPWPAPPEAWGPGDEAKAAEYLADVDVTVWTPGRTAGRPLTFQPLPDFSSVRDDPDEFREAVDVAVESLVPRAKLTGASPKALHGQAVLREAITFYARRGGAGLQGLIDLLDSLPDGVSTLDGAEKIASDIAQTLKAARVNDPLFDGEGTPMDPGVLLTPPPGKRARVSVINFIGLAQDEQRQSFVNQLQMSLFAWVKKHPSDRPLGGLLVMDEAQTFAPSGAMTPCTRSTLALASQARKYGLGLVFATQAPKGLHNQIPGNATTQFYGRLNAPVQITAAQEMARAKGGTVSDIARLKGGEFYVATEGRPMVKIRTPLCLTYHPPSPLTAEEVIDRAKRP